MMRKIIFLDVDGTLIDYDNHIPESAVVAIRRHGGVIWSTRTGRSKVEMPPEIWDIGFDGMIGSSSSYRHKEEGYSVIPRDG